jgi:hypothetical protein
LFAGPVKDFARGAIPSSRVAIFVKKGLGYAVAQQKLKLDGDQGTFTVAKEI